MVDKTVPKSKAWPIRGVMIDTVRLTESYRYYETLIPRLARWGYNAIFAHITDDEGCAILLDNVNILPTPGAMSPEQWKSLINISAENGITVIPEVECLGHTGYITRLNCYAELREPPLGGSFWSICPVHPDSLKLVCRVIRSIAEVFNSPFIHIGMDEADIGGSRKTQNVLKEKAKWQIFGEYLNKVNDFVKTIGKRSIIWGDHLHQEPALADMVAKDVIICNWLYGCGYSENYANLTSFFSEKGFDQLGCPAAVWNGTLFCSHRDNINNIRDFDNTCRSIVSEKILGMVNTVWTPFRYLPAVSQAAIYYGGCKFSLGSISERWLADFIIDQFDPVDPGLVKIEKALHYLIMERGRTKIEERLWPYNVDSLNKAADPLVRETANHLGKISRSAAILLEESVSYVGKNIDEFKQWIVTARMMERVFGSAEYFIRLNSLMFNKYSLKRISYNVDEKSITVQSRKLISLLRNILDDWRANNLKYRQYLGTRKELEAPENSTLYWGIEKTDHPVERMELTIQMLMGLQRADNI